MSDHLRIRHLDNLLILNDNYEVVKALHAEGFELAFTDSSYTDYDGKVHTVSLEVCEENDKYGNLIVGGELIKQVKVDEFYL